MNPQDSPMMRLLPIALRFSSSRTGHPLRYSHHPPVPAQDPVFMPFLPSLSMIIPPASPEAVFSGVFCGITCR